jgi:hypothetical protein
MSDEPAGAPRSGDDLRDVPGWRRTGLVLGWGAVAAACAALISWLPDREDPWPGAVVLLLAAVVAALLAPVFLRRAWSVPGVSDDPAVGRAHGWSDAALIAWGAGVLVGFVRNGFDVGWTWLDVLSALLGVVLAVSYVGMLVLATRWRPAPADQL